MRALAVMTLLVLASGCVEHQPDADVRCGAPFEHFDATTTLWNSLTNGTVHVPDGWTLRGQESPGIAAVLNVMTWRPDGKDMDEDHLHGEFTQIDGTRYMSPPVYRLAWSEVNGTSSPWLSVTYPNEATAENITMHVEWLFQAIGFPADWPDWTNRFLASAEDAGFGPSMYDNIRKVSTPATPTAKRYSLQWEGPDPSQTKLPSSAQASDWVGGSLFDGPFGFAAALPWRSYHELTTQDEVHISVRSDGHVEGSVAVTDAARDRHALVNETLASHGITVEGLTFVVDGMRGASTSNIGCDPT